MDIDLLSVFTTTVSDDPKFLWELDKGYDELDFAIDDITTMSCDSGSYQGKRKYMPTYDACMKFSAQLSEYLSVQEVDPAIERTLRTQLYCRILESSMRK